MGRKIERLTIAKIKRLTEPGMYADGDTLFLNITQTGCKSWIQRISILGKQREIGLGPLWEVSLTEARDKAFENRRLIRAGGNPLAEREAKRKVPTFREAAEAVIAVNRETWRGSRTEQNWRTQFDRYAFPTLGNMPVDRITQADVLACVEPIWTKKPETARKARMRIRKVLKWAEAHNHITRNVAGDAISEALPPMQHKATHRRALPYAETGAALATFAACTASDAVKLCLRFVILTGCRSAEAREATWSEIDLASQTWIVPADRRKGDAKQKKFDADWSVPLSTEAVAVLTAAAALADGSGLVFPSPHKTGKSLSDMTLTRVLKVTGLHERATVHGFRSTFRTWLSEQTSASFEVMELSIGHSVGNAVQKSYARSDQLEKRRALIQQWADYLTAPRDGRVVAFNRAGR